MMDSSNGNIFRVTCTLCGEFVNSPHIGQCRGALMFSAAEPTVEQIMDKPIIWDAIALIITPL